MATSYNVFIKMQTEGASRASRDIRSIETSSKSASSATLLLSKALSVLGGSFAVHKIIEANDAWIDFTNNLKSAGLAGQELVTTQQAIYDIAQQTHTQLKESAHLYRVLKTTIGEAGASQEDLLKVTKALNEGIQQSGASRQQQIGGIQQLGEVFEKGRLYARQYLSIVSDFPAIGNLLRQAFLQASGGTESFRQQMDEGKISSEAFFMALKAISSQLDATQNTLEVTSKQGLTDLSSAFSRLAGDIIPNVGSKLEKVASGVDILTDSIQILSKNSESVFKSIASSIAPIGEALGKLKFDFFEANADEVKNNFVSDMESMAKSVGMLAIKTFALNSTLTGTSFLPKMKTDTKNLGDYSGKVEGLVTDFKDLGSAGVIAQKAINSVINPKVVIKGDMPDITQPTINFKDEDLKNIRDAENAYKGLSASQEVTSKTYDQLSLAIARQRESLTSIDPLYAQVAQNADKLTKSQIDNLNASIKNLDEAKSTSELLHSVTDTFAGSFADAIANITTGSESASQAFKEMANSIISDLIRIGLEKAAIGMVNMGVNWYMGGSSAGMNTGGTTGGLQSATPPSFSNNLQAPSPPPMLSSGLRSTPSVGSTVNINTTVNTTHTGASGAKDGEKVAKEQAKMIATMVNTQVQQELMKQKRVGGML